MEIFRVSLFGHREIDDLRVLDERLAPSIKRFLQEKEHVSFLIGRNGEFDEYAASLIKHIQRITGKENSDLTLVLPYQVAKMEYYEEYYDAILLPDRVIGAHPKSAITLKNRWMVECADLLIVYVERQAGGAYAAMKYAESLHKPIVNLYKDKNESPQ